MRISEPAVQARHTATPWHTSSSSMGIHTYVEARICTGVIQEIACCGPTEGDEGSAGNAEFIVRACNAHQELVTELIKAEKIILTMLNAMSPTQRDKVMRKLESDGVSEDGATRYHERRAAISKATATE